MHAGDLLREELRRKEPLEPFLGIYDTFSGIIAGKHTRNLFFSGFGFAAGHYGLPDIGYISWSDMVQAVWRVRQALPDHRLLVDIDDGYVDVHTACYVVSQLENMGAAMVMLEDQMRPRRCGHADGKLILPLNQYLEKLEAVLQNRTSICVMARTDSSGDEIYRRVEAISKTDADALLVDGITSVEILHQVRRSTHKPLVFNQIAGGKSPRMTIAELRDAGVDLIQYSTPLLFAAQTAMEQAASDLFTNGGSLADSLNGLRVGVRECTSLLTERAEKNSYTRSVKP